MINSNTFKHLVTSFYFSGQPFGKQRKGNKLIVNLQLIYMDIPNISPAFHQSKAKNKGDEGLTMEFMCNFQISRLVVIIVMYLLVQQNPSYYNNKPVEMKILHRA